MHEKYINDMITIQGYYLFSYAEEKRKKKERERERKKHLDIFLTSATDIGP